MAQARYVVRVVLHENDKLTGLNEGMRGLLEQLRYAGLVAVHDTGDFRRLVFDMLPPHGVNEKAWADQNEARMRSFLYNVAVCPRSQPIE